jgi:hypothetical protein
MSVNTSLQIVSADEPPSAPSPRRSLGGLRFAPKRRVILKAMVFGCVALGGQFLLMTTRISKAWGIETSPDGTSQGWELPCSWDYPEQTDTSGDYVSWNGACIGGDFRGSNYCGDNGWHRRDTIHVPNNYDKDFSRVHSRCWSNSSLNRPSGADSLNSWRWKIQSSGNVFRCSDGKMVVTLLPDGGSHTYDTVCRWEV